MSKKIVTALWAAILCSACGGGGGDSGGGTTMPPSNPMPSLNIADTSVTEGDTGDTVLNFTVTMSGTSTQAVSVNYATSDGTAASPADFDAATGTLSIAAGTTSGLIAVTVHGDADDEGNESFEMVLSGPVNGTIARARATGRVF